MGSVFVLLECNSGCNEEILGVYQTFEDATAAADNMANLDLFIREWEFGARQDKNWWYCTTIKKSVAKNWKKYEGESYLQYDKS